MAVEGRLRGVLDALEADDDDAVRTWLRHPMTHLEDTELSTGATALVYSALHGSARAMSLLLEAGANPFAVDDGGRTALHTAASASAPECVRLLLVHLRLIPAKMNKSKPEGAHTLRESATVEDSEDHMDSIDGMHNIDQALGGARKSLVARDHGGTPPLAAAVMSCGAHCTCGSAISASGLERVQRLHDSHGECLAQNSTETLTIVGDSTSCNASECVRLLHRAGAALHEERCVPLAASRGAYGALLTVLTLGSGCAIIHDRVGSANDASDAELNQFPEIIPTTGSEYEHI